MYSKIHTAILEGIQTQPVVVEVDISNGMPSFEMVGQLSRSVREGKERIRTALHSVGVILPAKRITINLSPANIQKSGTGFDLPIAIAILQSIGVVSEEQCKNRIFVGELGLNGRILPVNGVLPIVSDGVNADIYEFVIPKENENEGKLVKQAKIFAFSHLNDVIAFLNGKPYEEELSEESDCQEALLSKDFSEVRGQQFLKRACEVAAAGLHALLFVGPPGAGKTMIAERFATILPPMSEEEQLELSKVYSVCGLLKNKKTLMKQRPFRAPHHTISIPGLIGGGTIPKPGEISLAHNGVLFLDELPEFQKNTIEVLRQPLEDHKIRLVRSKVSVTYPANFLLLAAMNPCNCGYYPDMSRCRCSPSGLQRYMDRVSQPLLDRIDICVEAPSLSFADLHYIEGKQGESSKEIQKRVLECHQIQCERYEKEVFSHNSHIPAAKLEEYCHLEKSEAEYMEEIYEKMSLTARTYHKILRVARTIADLDGKEQIELTHLMEAVCYRNIDSKFWGGKS